MTSSDRKELIAWLESRYKDTPMPGAKRMFRLALEAAREQENEPLTLEQLRQMYDEPVWVVCGIYKDWRIPEFIDEGGYKGFIKFTDRSAEPISDYGKNWLAYRYPPERSENDA